MKILHISAECYPAAKAGGLGDVVGALPKYLTQSGYPAAAIIPKYHTDWINRQVFVPVFKGAIRLHNSHVPFTVSKEKGDTLGFQLFVVDIPGKFDRPGVYADPSGRPFGDELERYLTFQQAVLTWIINSPGRNPDILHCHDHHTGLVPFMVKYCPEYQALKDTPTVFTIHNGVYHGAFSWQNMYLLPYFEGQGRGMLEWSDLINPLAAGIKCAWAVTTVSPSYLEELKHNSNGMEWLLIHEQNKSVGILNGIDAQVWNPKEDPYLAFRLKKDVTKFKQKNKQALKERFRFEEDLPVITFIGRMAREKGADLLPGLIRKALNSGLKMVFLVLGTGDRNIMNELWHLREEFFGRFDVALEYNEGLAHQLYAGSDYLIMPSRVEPCGLNQMYGMRYGTIPLVRTVGGLHDTVIDIGDSEEEGRGIRFNNFDVDDAYLAVYRAVDLFQKAELFTEIRERVMEIDFSWESAAGNYIRIYDELKD